MNKGVSLALLRKYTTTWELQFPYLIHLNTLTVQHRTSCEPLTGLLRACRHALPRGKSGLVQGAFQY